MWRERYEVVVFYDDYWWDEDEWLCGDSLKVSRDGELWGDFVEKEYGVCGV